MDGNNIHKVAFFLVFVVLCQMAESHWKQVGPLCASQITLVNHACSFLPFTVNPPPHPSLVSAPPSPPNRDPRHRHRHGHAPSPPHRHGHAPSPPRTEGRHRHRHAPSPPRTEGRHRHVHAPSPHRPDGRHRHRHRHHHTHHDNPEEEICCRWLREVDDECVCELLAQLPAFLSRPVHQYTVIVGETCYESFQCGSRIKIND